MRGHFPLNTLDLEEPLDLKLSIEISEEAPGIYYAERPGDPR